MANPFILFILFSIIKIATARFIDGLYLEQERLKYGNHITEGNDYMDYNPESVPKDIIIQVPREGGNGNFYIGVPSDQMTVIEVQKVWSDDGTVTENINIHPVVEMVRRDVNPSRPVVPTNVDFMGPSEGVGPRGLDLNRQFATMGPRNLDLTPQPSAIASKEGDDPTDAVPRNVDFGILGYHAVPY